MRKLVSNIKSVVSAIFITGILFSLNVFGQAKLPDSPIKTVYITPFSHYDFGFVEPPEAIRERAARHIDEVIRVAEENPDFKWTIESVWQINEWLKRQKKPSSVLPKDKEKIARLVALVRSGRIAVSAAWGSMHTDFMGAEELNRLIYGYSALNRSFGIQSQMAMMNDVPGHPTAVPSVLAESGIKYMVTGANTFIGNATELAPGKVPFYWQAPDGSKVLTWISQGNRGAYVEAVTEFYLDPFSHDPYTDRRPFNMFNPELIGKKTPLQEMEFGMTRLLEHYNAAGYKYDAVMALYAHDFIEPTDVLNLQKAIALWKTNHPEIELKIATPPEFLKYIETKYGNEIPTYKGDWSGLWSESKTQSPRISALARYTHDHMPAAETLWSAVSMTSQIPAPTGNIESILDRVLTYDEHSGAGNNGWPQLNSRKPLEDQNRQYVDFMNEAVEETNGLLKSGIQVLAQPTRFDDVSPANNGNVRPVVVYNGLSWTRNDVVRLAPPKKGTRIATIRRAWDKAVVEFDVDRDGNAIFVARDVPSMGYASYEVTIEPGEPATTLKPQRGMKAANSRYTVEASADGTIKSIFDGRLKRELVNSSGELPFNTLLRVEGSDASKTFDPVAARVAVYKGKLMSEIRIEREGSVFPATVVSFYDGVDRVDLQNELDPARFPFVGGNMNWSDSYYFAFPFNVGKQGLKVIRSGQKWFEMMPDDYLPGARRDSVSTRHLIGVTDGQNSAFAAQRQAFHWVYSGFVSTKVRPRNAAPEFPAMFTGKFPLPEATLYSRAIRQSSQADTHDLGTLNIKSVEPGMTGRMLFDYAFSLDGVFDPVKAWRLGAAFNLPLRGYFTDLMPGDVRKGFFSVDSDNVQIVTVKALAENVIRGEVSSAPLNPKSNKIFVVRLQEFAGRAANVTVGLPVKIKNASFMSLTEDRAIEPITRVSPLVVPMRPYQTATVRIEIE